MGSVSSRWPLRNINFVLRWAQNRDGFTEHSDGDEFGDAKSVAVLATRNNSRSADNIQRTFESNYLRKRGISDCIKRVEVMEVRSFEKRDIDDELDRLGYMPDLVIAIIDDGKGKGHGYSLMVLFINFETEACRSRSLHALLKEGSKPNVYQNHTFYQYSKRLNEF